MSVWCSSGAEGSVRLSGAGVMIVSCRLWVLENELQPSVDTRLIKQVEKNCFL